MDRFDYSLEVVLLERGATLRGATLDRCAVLLTKDNEITSCSFSNCALLNRDGTPLMFKDIVGADAPLAFNLPLDAAALLGPQIRALGGHRFTQDKH